MEHVPLSAVWGQGSSSVEPPPGKGVRGGVP